MKAAVYDRDGHVYDLDGHHDLYMTVMYMIVTVTMIVSTLIWCHSTCSCLTQLTR